jgi:hypothetical protein
MKHRRPANRSREAARQVAPVRFTETTPGTYRSTLQGQRIEARQGHCGGLVVDDMPNTRW